MSIAGAQTDLEVAVILAVVDEITGGIGQPTDQPNQLTRIHRLRNLHIKPLSGHNQPAAPVAILLLLPPCCRIQDITVID